MNFKLKLILNFFLFFYLSKNFLMQKETYSPEDLKEFFFNKKNNKQNNDQQNIDIEKKDDGSSSGFPNITFFSDQNTLKSILKDSKENQENQLLIKNKNYSDPENKQLFASIFKNLQNKSSHVEGELNLKELAILNVEEFKKIFEGIVTLGANQNIIKKTIDDAQKININYNYQLFSNFSNRMVDLEEKLNNNSNQNNLIILKIDNINKNNLDMNKQIKICNKYFRKRDLFFGGLLLLNLTAVSIVLFNQEY
jgi:hypothetical protein